MKPENRSGAGASNGPDAAASETRSEVSRLLAAVNAEEPGAASQLYERVYAELKRISKWRLRGERPGHTLQTTALVNDAYLRLVGEGEAPSTWENRAHFFAAAAEAMRRILVDSAKRRLALKRGGDRQRVPLDEDLASVEPAHVDLVALDEALVRLAERDPRKAEVIKHRFFLGLTVPETAECLGVSARTVDDDWALARAWLRREMAAGTPDGEGAVDERSS